MKIKFGELNARMLCQFTSFAEVVNGVFGVKKESSPTDVGEYEDLAVGGSAESAIANINRALTFG